LVVIALRNDGRGSAAAPYLELAVEPPYVIEPRGVGSPLLDGAMGFIPQAVPGPAHRYAGRRDFLIHPGMEVDVAAVVGWLNDEEPRWPPLTIKSRVGAENVPLTDLEIRIEGQELLKISGREPNPPENDEASP